MNQKTRIRKLEEVGQSKLTVVVPVFADNEGEEISLPSLFGTVASAHCRPDGYSIERDADEEPRDFHQRVMSIARARYKPCVVLQFGSADV